MIWIVIIGLIASGASKGVQDVLSFHYSGSFWEKIEEKNEWLFFGPDSWKNKHNYTGIWTKIMKGPLVFLTDGWHLFQFIRLNAWQLPFAYLLANEFYSGLWWEVIAAYMAVKIVFAVGFYLTWK